MILVSAKVGPFRSIEEPQDVAIDTTVTVLVGMNEAGKTVFLKALEKSADVYGFAKFDAVEDYPRKRLTTYLKTHETNPDVVTMLEYELTDDEVNAINTELNSDLSKGYRFTIARKYNNTETLESAPPEVGRWLERHAPRFLYFGEYDILPSKTNINDLRNRVEQNKNNQLPPEHPQSLGPQHRGILALLQMADVSVADFNDQSGYETLKAKLEATSIHLTDQIMNFWKQNEDLEVQIDINPDARDNVPFNNGPNLYLRIANRRHRGVTTPFHQRSKGFIWFFSFLVWFDEVQNQLKQGGDKSRSLILLLDEPGLSLHALAQADFLRYIDQLAERHQVLYTTHSPFLVHMDKLHQVRLVEDRPGAGTVITDTVLDSNEKTVFPLPELVNSFETP